MDMIPSYQVVPGPSPFDLNFVEKLALKVALGIIARGDTPPPGMSIVCILALARLTGIQEI